MTSTNRKEMIARVALDDHLKPALDKLEKAQTALEVAASEVPNANDEPGKTRKYDLALMAEEVFDISDRLVTIMHAEGIAIPATKP